MRKLRVFESISIDGYFTDAKGDMSWAHAVKQDAEFADWVGANAGSGGELLFGRKTYQMMEAFWQGDLMEAVRDLKSSDGPDIAVLGSGSVAAQLGEAGLVDDYQFVIIPVALGGGRTVFANGRRKFRLVNQRAFQCGNVVVTYAA